jgi:hypothetical protein
MMRQTRVVYNGSLQRSLQLNSYLYLKPAASGVSMFTTILSSKMLLHCL